MGGGGGGSVTGSPTEHTGEAAPTLGLLERRGQTHARKRHSETTRLGLPVSPPRPGPTLCGGDAQRRESWSSSCPGNSVPRRVLPPESSEDYLCSLLRAAGLLRVSPLLETSTPFILRGASKPGHRSSREETPRQPGVPMSLSRPPRRLTLPTLPGFRPRCLHGTPRGPVCVPRQKQPSPVFSRG